MATGAAPDITFDIAIIGGGINGCGLARDAAGRGWSVYLCEQNDLASGTSSASTKLIHGGLRYLEHWQFRLVRESLLEREVVWRIAPHVVRPLRFVLPHHKGLRPAWLLRLGLFLYDHLGGRSALPATRTLDLTREAAGAPLHPGRFSLGFAYADCWVDDARLVVLNAMDAAQHGATIETRHALISAEREGGVWLATIVDRGSGVAKQIRARALVNAAGPWVPEIAPRLRGEGPAPVRLVKGSHIMVPKLFDHGDSYIFQAAGGRVVFAIPYEDRFTLIGTTDCDFTGDPAEVAISIAEIDYLIGAASEYFDTPITPDSIVWTYAGVRSLYDDHSRSAQAVTRDYVLQLQHADGAAPLLSIYGGKITTYRRLAEAALRKLETYLSAPAGKTAGWTGKEPLPGGEFPADAIEDVVAGLRSDYPFLDRAWALRLARAYGLRARNWLGQAKAASDLGRQFGATLSEAEVCYLCQGEWAQTAEDILWRRSKLGLQVGNAGQRAVAAYLAEATSER